MKYEINNMLSGSSIPLGSFGSFNLSQGSETYIRETGSKLIPDFILDIFGTRPAPTTTTPALDPRILYGVGAAGGLLLLFLVMKKQGRRNGNGYRRAPARRKYRPRRKR